MEEIDDRRWNEAAEAGARPVGVPIRVYGAYLEARAALRANAPQVATRVLEWLLAHLAEERGVRMGGGLAEIIAKLRDAGVIAKALDETLIARALNPADRRARAWALLSIVEHALQRLYLHKAA